MSVHHLPPAHQAPQPSGPGGGNGLEGRLRQLEIELGRLDVKVDGIKENMATKAWVLGGVIGGVVLALGVAIALLRWGGPIPPLSGG